MTKLFQAFFTGIFFTFILDFFLFLGLKLNYIDILQINVYYNILFADHQNIYIYLVFSAFLGFIITYIDNQKLNALTLGILFSLVSLTLIPPIGKYVGELMFLKKGITLQDAKRSYQGDIYYYGRKEVKFYDYKLKKVIILKRNRLDFLHNIDIPQRDKEG